MSAGYARSLPRVDIVEQVQRRRGRLLGWARTTAGAAGLS